MRMREANCRRVKEEERVSPMREKSHSVSRDMIGVGWGSGVVTFSCRTEEEVDDE